MSAYITVQGIGHTSRCRRAAAKRKVARGSHRWVDLFTIEEIAPAVASSNMRPFRFGPSAGFTDWLPRPSANYLVMQLRTAKRATV